MLCCGLLALAPSPAACAGSVTLAWDPLDDPSVAAYAIHYGPMPGRYSASVLVSDGTSVTVSNLTEGLTNYFAVTSVDVSGLESDYSDEIAIFLLLPVTVVMSGLGTVLSWAYTWDPAQKIYNVVARPAAGMIFAGWTGSLPSSDYMLTFEWTSNVVLQANFVPIPQGTYNGLYAEASQIELLTSGAFSVAISRLGACSGRLQVGANRFPFTARLDALGQANLLVSRHTNSPLFLTFNVGLGTDTGQISGMLTDGNWISKLWAERAIFNGTTSLAPYAGNYTVVFPGADGDPAVPAGDGFGTIHVSRAGLASFAGTLADGVNVTQAATVSGSGLWPMYLPLYRGQGALLGWPAFTNLNSSADFGRLTWIKPADSLTQFYPDGFTNQLAAFASPFREPAGFAGRILTLTNAAVTFSGGNLASDFTNEVAIFPHGSVSTLNGTSQNMVISSVNGIFHGNVVDPSSGRRFIFKGAVLQNLDAASGFLPGTNHSSRVLITPAE